jgi:hypothetical protein
MKRTILTVIFCAVAIALQAQTMEENYVTVSKNLKEKTAVFVPFEKSFNELIAKGQISVTGEKEIKSGKYTTSEFIHPALHEDPEYMQEIGFDAKDPAPETKTTNGYVEATIRIPAGVQFWPETNNEGYFPIGTSNAIFVIINDIPSLFKLDYNIKLESPALQNKVQTQEIDEFTTNEYASTANAKLITIKYSPRYFTLVKNYSTPENVPNSLNKSVATIPVVVAQSKGCKEVAFYLVPNVDNILNDFKFVKDGPSPFIYEQIKDAIIPQSQSTLARVK